MERDYQKPQNLNSVLWDRVYQYHDGIKYPHEELVKFINYIKQWEYMKSLSALDIGFGCFPNLKMCYEHGYDIYGIEVSQEALNRTIQKFKGLGIPFVCKLFNPPTIPFDDCKFSLVYSEEAIYYNLGLEKVISEIRRVLAPSGAIYLTFFAPRHWYFKYSEKVDDALVRWSNDFPTEALRGMTIRYFDSKEKLKKVFKGFKHLRVDDYSSNMLGAENYKWIVTGFKPGKNLRKFNFLNYVGNIAKPK